MRKWLYGVLAVVAAGCAGAPVPPAGTGGGAVRPLEAPWTMEGGGPARVSRSGAVLPESLDSQRMIPLVADPGYRPEEYATPLVAEGVAYVGHAGRAFAAVRLKDEKVLWSLKTRGRIYTTAAYVDGLFVIGDDQGTVRAVDTSGTEVWSFTVRYPVVSSPVAADGRVFVAVADQNVFCLDAASGSPIWQYGRKLPRRNPIWRGMGLCYGGGRVYATFADGTVVALDPEVGEVLWRAQVGSAEWFGDAVGGPAYRDGRVYAGAFRGPVVCLDASTGETLWSAEVATLGPFAVGDERLYAATPSETLAALSLEDGSILWEKSYKAGALAPPVFTPRALVTASAKGQLIVVDPSTGEKREGYLLGTGFRGQPLVYPGGVVLLSDAGTLFWVK
ncbi:MAG: hypothetical protein Kow0092_20640 [Deferrisomatales bacterium]